MARAQVGRSLNQGKSYVITSWDDTARIDLKLADMLDKYGVKGTFYVITGQIGDKVSASDLKHIAKFHEIGAHTVTHPHLCRIDLEMARREIFGSKTALEKILESNCAMSFAYPYGEYNSNHMAMLKQAGFCCGRTTRPFFIEHPKNIYEMPVSVWAYPHELKDIRGLLRVGRIFPSSFVKLHALKNWSSLARKLLDIVVQRDGVFHLYGHAWQIEQNNGWKNLEEVLSYIATQEKTTCLTVAQYSNLHVSADCNRTHNSLKI